MKLTNCPPFAMALGSFSSLSGALNPLRNQYSNRTLILDSRLGGSESSLCEGVASVLHTALASAMVLTGPESALFGVNGIVPMSCNPMDRCKKSKSETE